jgi:hypothetical protein
VDVTVSQMDIKCGHVLIVDLLVNWENYYYTFSNIYYMSTRVNAIQTYT